MDIMETGAPTPSEESRNNRFGIPVVAVIGLPLLALLIVLFVGFALTLQNQRAELTKAYAERTAEYLALDLAHQLGGLFTPVEEYTTDLVAQIKQAGCNSAQCAFSVISKQRTMLAQIPDQISIIRFGATNGETFGINKLNDVDHDYRGVVRTPEGNPTRLVSMENGTRVADIPYNVFKRGWYQAGMVDKEPVWSAPYVRNGRLHAWAINNSWRMTRIARVDGPDGVPLGVVAVDVGIENVGTLLKGIIGNTVERISVLPSSGEEISIVDGKLSIIPNLSPRVKPVVNAVPLKVSGLRNWRLAVKLTPQLSQQIAWNWYHTLLLLVGLLTSIALTAIAAGFVVNPIRRLSSAVADVSNLKLDNPISVPTGIREVGFLGSVIEKMRAGLHRDQTRLEFLAYHDPDSGFLNQAGLTRAFGTMNAKDGHIDLILIKVCNYNQIASIFSDAVLARLLVSKINLLQAELEGGVAACLNNNQIAYIFPSEEGVDAPRMERLLEKVRLPYEDSGIRISPAIAAAVASRHDSTDGFERLLRRANGAMHHAEDTQSQNAVWYNPALLQDLRAVLDFGGNIAQAIARGEFSVSYQPVVDLRTGKICEAQASVIWHHPEFGDIRSHKFIPILERNGSIRHLGFFVMSRAFEFLHNFKSRMQGQRLQVGVKLSFAQLMDPLFIERVTELQAEWSIASAEIKFIVAQDVALLEDQQVFKTMRKLRKLGFHLTIDQFAMAHATVNGSTAGMMIGTGVYRGIEQPGVERLILEAACELARKLGMESTAVGIDNHAIIEPLIKCGCTYGRGPWFGRSTDEREFLRLYDENAAMFPDEAKNDIVYQI